MKHFATFVTIALQTVMLVANAQTADKPLDACFGEKRAITIARQMPYIPVKMGNAEGEFVLDFGSNVTSIDPAGFKNGIKPIPKNNAALVYEQAYFFDKFDFFNRTGDVKLLVRKTTVSNLGLQQAGILGTDFFMEFIFTLDYINKFLYKSTKDAFCKDDALSKAGFKPVSTEGYYADQFSRLKDPNTTINVPTVPVKIGRVEAVAQIDPGYDDTLYPHTVNINRAFFTALKTAGVKLTSVPNVQLTTCSGQNEPGTAYHLAPGYNFEITGMNNEPVLVEHDAFIIIKEGNIAQGCAGIGTWPIPAAQIGASFLVDTKKIVFDPFSSRVWFQTGLASGTTSTQMSAAPKGPQMQPKQEVQPANKDKKKRR